MVEPLFAVRQKYEKVNMPDVFLVNEHEKRIGILVEQAILDQKEFCVYHVEHIPGPYPPVTLLQMVNHLLLNLRRKGYTVSLVPSSDRWVLKIEGWATPILPELRAKAQFTHKETASSKPNSALSNRISKVVKLHSLKTSKPILRRDTTRIPQGHRK